MSDMKQAAAPEKVVTPGGDFLRVWENDHVRVNVRYASGMIVVGIESEPIESGSGPWFTHYSNVPVRIARDEEQDEDALALGQTIAIGVAAIMALPNMPDMVERRGQEIMRAADDLVAVCDRAVIARDGHLAKIQEDS